MYSSTHALFGMVMGASVYITSTHREKAKTIEFFKMQVVGAVASILGDLPLLIQMANNVANDRHPLACGSRLVTESMPLLHSLLLCAYVYAIAVRIDQRWKLGSIVRIRLCGAAYAWHLLVDAMTHGRNAHGYLWPLPIKLERFIGFWNYHPMDGFLPRKPELLLVYLLTVALLSLWVYHLHNMPVVRFGHILYDRPLQVSHSGES